jgi:hypothetical protein
MTTITLTTETVEALESEYGPICEPRSSLEDLANILLRGYVTRMRKARELAEALT